MDIADSLISQRFFSLTIIIMAGRVLSKDSGEPCSLRSRFGQFYPVIISDVYRILPEVRTDFEYTHPKTRPFFSFDKFMLHLIIFSKFHSAFWSFPLYKANTLQKMNICLVQFIHGTSENPKSGFHVDTRSVTNF